MVTEAFDPATAPKPFPPLKSFTAIWDTGATASAITQNVVDACGLSPIGMARVHTADGEVDSEVYLINMGLPNGMGVVHVQVTKAKLGPSADVLIGMDIISNGDFSITNKDGRTFFSFRIPSAVHVDFVKEYNDAKLEHELEQQRAGKS